MMCGSVEHPHLFKMVTFGNSLSNVIWQLFSAAKNAYLMSDFGWCMGSSWNKLQLSFGNKVKIFVFLYLMESTK